MEFFEDFSSIGTIEIEIPARDNKPKRTACLEVKFGKFMMDPPKRHIRYKELYNLPLYAVYGVLSS
ncbi:hypothetical protein ABLO99_00480 [Wolbachia endosymbiont of Armadillidium arcangelii]|uniref:Uncharacterized protein n=1 Tax=Wolbachia endosymbiont of Armadillidium arcangelii TaxID=3158571 RepID=A0AAU7Q499_9RICK